ncbi:MAG TPA: hypothetical protein PKA74_14630 [Bauldia sp.]|nr:hypothetical protein [Bauldia sp.]
MGILWEVSLGDFLLVTVFLGGGAAYLTGRAVAITWRPVFKLVVYVLLLTAAVRFVHYALFGGTLLSLQYYLFDLAILLCFAGLGFQLTRARQMTGQYSWLYTRAGGLSWRDRQGAPGRR